MYTVKSTVHRLPPDKKRKAISEAKILFGVNIHVNPKGYEVTEIQLFRELPRLIELMALGEIHVFLGTVRQSSADLLLAKKVYEEKKLQPVIPPPTPPTPAPPPKPVKVEPPPAPIPAPEPEPELEPETEIETEPGEVTYTKAELEDMTKDALLDLAGSMGIQDKVNYKDKKKSIVDVIWKNLK